MLVEGWAPLWLGEAWTLPAQQSMQLFALPTLLFVCSFSAYIFSFPEWSRSLLHLCSQQLEIELEPDFHTYLIPVFSVQVAQCASVPCLLCKPAARPCIQRHVCPQAALPTAWLISGPRGQSLKFFLLHPAFQALLLILVICSPEVEDRALGTEGFIKIPVEYFSSVKGTSLLLCQLWEDTQTVSVVKRCILILGLEIVLFIPGSSLTFSELA